MMTSFRCIIIAHLISSCRGSYRVSFSSRVILLQLLRSNINLMNIWFNIRYQKEEKLFKVNNLDTINHSIGYYKIIIHTWQIVFCWYASTKSIWIRENRRELLNSIQCLIFRTSQQQFVEDIRSVRVSPTDIDRERKTERERERERVRKKIPNILYWQAVTWAGIARWTVLLIQLGI